uniref:Uncharacterized protein n=1 Tax=Anguilla anguilla TaxID=7936 RepID=A0A0E9SMW1_ANGAN
MFVCFVKEVTVTLPNCKVHLCKAFSRCLYVVATLSPVTSGGSLPRPTDLRFQPIRLAL